MVLMIIFSLLKRSISLETTILFIDSCPSENAGGIGDLKVRIKGRTVSCLSPCKKWNYPPPYGLGRSEKQSPGDMLCCPTPPISPQTCRSGIVESTNYVRMIHSVCPTAYSYAYDDKAGLHNCPGGTSFDVTLCPRGNQDMISESFKNMGGGELKNVQKFVPYTKKFAFYFSFMLQFDPAKSVQSKSFYSESVESVESTDTNN